MSALVCSTCNGEGSVECVDYDGSGYEQDCPDCDGGVQVNGVIPSGESPVPDEKRCAAG